MSELLLGIDIGTTGTKVTLFDPEEGVLATRSESSPLFSPEPGWSEADTSVWWHNLCTLVPAVAAGRRGEAFGHIGLASSGMVPAVILLGKDGTVLRRAILQNDSRAVEEISELNGVLEAEGFDALSRTGSALTQQSDCAHVALADPSRARAGKPGDRSRRLLRLDGYCARRERARRVQLGIGERPLRAFGQSGRDRDRRLRHAELDMCLDPPARPDRWYGKPLSCEGDVAQGRHPDLRGRR